MFMLVLSMFWGVPDIMAPQSCVCITVSAPSRLRLSLTEQGWATFKVKFNQVAQVTNLMTNEASREKAECWRQAKGEMQ